MGAIQACWYPTSGAFRRIMKFTKRNLHVAGILRITHGVTAVDRAAGFVYRLGVSVPAKRPGTSVERRGVGWISRPACFED